MSGVLEQHLNSLREHGKYTVELVEVDDVKNVIIRSYPLPPGWTKSSSDLLLRLDPAYPNSKPDMFWLEVEVMLPGGGVPKSAEEPLEILGKKWRRFSWHLTNWNPATGDLLLFLAFIEARLAKIE